MSTMCLFKFVSWDLAFGDSKTSTLVGIVDDTPPYNDTFIIMKQTTMLIKTLRVKVTTMVLAMVGKRTETIGGIKTHSPVAKVMQVITT